MHWYLYVIKNYAVFRGRATRTEYWMFFLFNLLFTFVLGYLDGVMEMGVLSLVYSLFILLPSIAVAVRRLHDTGRTGWWLLLTLIPLIGGLVILVFLVLDSEEGENEYGANLKQISNDVRTDSD